MAGKRIVVVGNGRMAQQCVAILLNHADCRLVLVIAEARQDPAQARLTRFCDEHQVPMLRAEASVNDRAIVARVAAAKPDFILSIDNMQVFGKELLATPVRGSVNFHNGLIERYRGVNIPSWAIFNGEAEHGVSWHYMNRSVDTGDVVAARRFMLTGKETALSLTLECIRVGIELFAEHLQSLLAGNRTRVDVAGARVYRHRDLPNDGYLDLRWPSAQIDRMLRATDFRPFPNPFCYARIRFPAGELIVNEAQPMAHTGTPVPGEIVAADDKLVLACGDAALDITAVMLSPEEEATVKNAVAALGLAAGQRAIRASSGTARADLYDRPYR